MTRWSLLAGLISLAVYSGFAQPAKIILRDSSAVESNLKTYSEEYLLTWSGKVKLSTILAVRFDAKYKKKAEFFLGKFSETGIVVYIGEVRIDPQGTLQTATRDVIPEVHGFVTENSPLPVKADIGIGGGLDYGGFGGRITYYPVQKLGIFAGVGYVFVGLGFNGGLRYKFAPNRARVTGFVTAMYGYNAAIITEGFSAYNKVYYGPSIGAGIEIKSRKHNRNFLNLEILIPFRSSDFDKDYDFIKQQYNIRIPPLPITLSIGYHFGIHRN